MNDFCIYCGSKKDLTRDHIPPKSFFPKPRPSKLITVPSCKICNSKYGKDDERLRNLLTSLELTESHPAIQTDISKKRNRSLIRKKGYSNFRHMLESMKDVDIFSKGGIYLETRKAFNLDQQIVDIFLERVTRALLFIENQVVINNFNFRWKLTPSKNEIETFPNHIKHFFLNSDYKSIGDNIFQYKGIYFPKRASSLWIIKFYNGVEFITFLKE